MNSEAASGARAVLRTTCHEISTIDEFLEVLGADDGERVDVVVQGLDLHSVGALMLGLGWHGTTFLGCRMPDDVELHVIGAGATVFPPFDGLPYDPYRAELYTSSELSADDLDLGIYEHQAKWRHSEPLPILESLAQRIHDHAIDGALDEFLASHEKVVAIMGGHSLKRDDPGFATVARLARSLALRGYLVVTGGGPGAMEAGNLGAWLAAYGEDSIDRAVSMLAAQSDFATEEYVRAAVSVVEQFSDGSASLAIPTWFYGHEPTNVFATAVAKYFSNSIREDGLLAIATHGVVYTPGSAGTVQEVFMDATQNHYGTFDLVSPMVFLDSTYWADDRLGAPKLLHQLAADRPYADMITVLDDPTAVLDFIETHPPHPIGV